MLNESIIHCGEMINTACQLMSAYFQKTVHFSKIIQLSGSDRRNLIVRLLIDNPTTDMPQSLILKQTATETNQFDASNKSETEIEQLSRFAHDWAGTEFLTQLGGNHGPHFYAGSLEHKFIIIEDLGSQHPSLVGPLTRSASIAHLQEAESALLAYVRRLGQMHADTLGKYNQFTAILNKIYSPALRFNFIPHTDGVDIFNQFKSLIGNESPELRQEIQEIIEFSQGRDDFNVLLHGDICPDNVYYTNNEIRLIDFEFSDFGNAFIDGAYLRMYMPSCWCSKAVPKSVLHRMESEYRDALKSGILAVTDDVIYAKQLTYACGYWLLKTLGQLYNMDLIDHEWICPSGHVDDDSLWNPKENAFRPRILSRLDAFIRTAKKYHHFPKLCEASLQLLTHLKKIWPETSYIDFFPVFKSEENNLMNTKDDL